MIKFIQGHNRTQINLFPVSLDQSIDPDNEVRIIDLFVARAPMWGLCSLHITSGGLVIF